MMRDYRRYDPPLLLPVVRATLGAVFVSTAALDFFERMVNGQGLLQLDDRLESHAGGNYGLVPDDEVQKRLRTFDAFTISSLHTVGDYLNIVTDRHRGRTTVWLSGEDGYPSTR